MLSPEPVRAHLNQLLPEALRLLEGMVGINSFALAASEAPFGGTNYSGMGREGGSEGIGDYLDTKLAQIVL